MTISFLGYLLIIIPALVNVAFLTLLERKVLGYAQARKGPNKVRAAGVLQPFADAVKLFLKERVLPTSGNLFTYRVAPVLRLLLTLWVWRLMPLREGPIRFSYSAVVLLMVIRFGVYATLLAGWASNSKYGLIGALRGVAQTISYEVRLALFLFRFLLVPVTLNLSLLRQTNSELALLGCLAPLVLLWFVSCLAETNRTPFDFAEGERELVSGFNIEYGRGGFALIFMAEYGSILFLSLLTASLIITSSTHTIVLYVLIRAIRVAWIWARATLPRYRYDILINLAWKRLLPVSLHFGILVRALVLWAL